MSVSMTPVPSFAQQSAAEIAQQILDKTDAPGVTVALKNGDAIDIAALGERALGSNVAVTSDDLWHVASNTKAMTGTLVARLVEAGVITWEDRIDDVLGDFIPDIELPYRRMTYRDLLTHRSGLAANVGRLNSIRLSGFAADRDLPADRLFYAGKVLTRTPKNTAPFPFVYSNAGYTVAATMLEVTTGKSWEELIRAYVFDPLGIRNVGNGPPGTVGALDQPQGHKRGLFGLRALEPKPGADNIPTLGPSGTVHIAMADFVLFLDLHARRDPEFLSEKSWDMLHTPREGEDYAIGWSVQEPLIFHNGSNTYWFSIGGFNARTGQIAAIVTNAAGQDEVNSMVTETFRNLLVSGGS